MNSENFRRFIRKIFVLSLPFVILLAVYFFTDPYKVINNYKEFSSKPLALNQSYVCWQNYLNHRDSMKYDSFLLGNSCTMAYRMSDWEAHLDNATAVSLMGNGEPLYSINAKLKKLASLNKPVKNLLILIDNSTLKYVTKPITHTFVLHRDICGDGLFSFQATFVQAFLNPKTLIPFLDFTMFGQRRPYMKGIIGRDIVLRNPLTNDLHNPREDEIKKDSLAYYKNHDSEFGKIVATDDGLVIGKKQLEILNEIKSYIDKMGASYKIIINPSYKQYKMLEGDLKLLESVFAKKNVFDYSGTQDFSSNRAYFYESNHYRPALGRKILNEIYK